MSKKKKLSLRNGIFLAVFLVIIGVIFVIARKGGDNGIEVTVKAVQRGDITSMVTATGRIQPEMEVVISSEVPGEIIELPVTDGATVDKGDLLVRVNPDTLEAQVKQQEASLAATRASAAQSRAQMLQAELDLRRVEDLHEKGFVTEDDLEQARTRLEVARAAYESATFQIQRQEMQLKEANDQLAKASLYSPIDGTITSLRSETGDRVVGTGQFAGTEIMRVANLENMEVQVDVSEADIINVAIGQKATVEVDALPDEPLTGYVTEIANSAKSTNERSQEQLTTFAVRIKLENPGRRLRPGMTATADIETDTVKDVVKVPLGSVVVRPRDELAKGEDGERRKDTDTSEDPHPGRGDRQNRKQDDRVRVVFLANEKTASIRQVETGIADRDSIEIQAGLEAGERIITGSYRALTRELKEGSRITERKTGGKPARD